MTPLSFADPSSVVAALRSYLDAMQRVSRRGRVSRLNAAALFGAMRHNSATHTDARVSAAIWTLRRARAGGCGRYSAWSSS